MKSFVKLFYTVIIFLYTVTFEIYTVIYTVNLDVFTVNIYINSVVTLILQNSTVDIGDMMTEHNILSDGGIVILSAVNE